MHVDSEIKLLNISSGIFLALLPRSVCSKETGKQEADFMHVFGAENGI